MNHTIPRPEPDDHALGRSRGGWSTKTISAWIVADDPSRCGSPPARPATIRSCFPSSMTSAFRRAGLVGAPDLGLTA